jgi:hypothetical protein
LANPYVYVLPYYHNRSNLIKHNIAFNYYKSLGNTKIT